MFAFNDLLTNFIGFTQMQTHIKQNLNLVKKSVSIPVKRRVIPHHQ